MQRNAVSAIARFCSLAESRKHLDARFKHLGAVNRFGATVHGWVKAIREALGMTMEQLAKWLGVKQSSVVALELSEAKGTIEFATPWRAAEAPTVP